MSTITSPRPAPPSTLTTPTTSSRASLSLSDLASPTHSVQKRAPSPLPARRNRAALRDYYGLKSAAPVDASNGTQHAAAEEAGGEVKESELDREGFDAEGYVRGVLGREGMTGLLGVEGGLVGEIKALDGERKALVYDNYSKLITATDTIRKMRATMTPLTPANSTLSPAIAHIANVAASLATSFQDPNPQTQHTEDEHQHMKRKQQQDTVRYVLATPARLRKLLAEGKREEARKEWEEVEGLLGRWEGQGVEGARGIREEGGRVMEEGEGEVEGADGVS